jgi:type IV secretion system protein VirB6
MGFFAEFNTWLTTILDDYIHQYTALMAQILEPALVTLGSIYVLLWGFLHIAGRIEEPLLEGLKRIAILGLVFGIGLDLWLYDSVIVDIFYRAPATLASRLVGGKDFVTIVDTIFQRGDDVATALLAKAGVLNGNFSFYLAAAAVWLMVIITGVYTMFLLTLSRIALSILLGVGPLVIPLFLFQTTRRFVEAWIAQLALYGFVAILSGLVAAFMMHLIDAASAQAQAMGGGIQIVHAVRVCIAAGFTFLVMRQVLPLAGGLASGLALSTFGVISSALYNVRSRASFSAGQFIRGALLDRETTRWDPLTRKAGYHLNRGVRSLFRRGNAVER